MLNRILYNVCVSLMFLCLVSLVFVTKDECNSHIMPDVKPCDISIIVKKTTWTENDYKTLTMQTGLTQASLDILKQTNHIYDIFSTQKAYFTPVKTTCTPKFMLSRTERLNSALSPITALENGDILVTPCSHVLGFRNGHCAVVVDAEKGITLEAAFIGRNSDFGTVSRWQKYASVAVYRLKGADSETRDKIAEFSAKNLVNKPYSLFSGIFSNDNQTTHCSYLVWYAFNEFGFNLNSDNGKIITPSDIAKSPLLELKQVYGLPLTYKS